MRSKGACKPPKAAMRPKGGCPLNGSPTPQALYTPARYLTKTATVSCAAAWCAGPSFSLHLPFVLPSDPRSSDPRSSDLASCSASVAPSSPSNTHCIPFGFLPHGLQCIPKYSTPAPTERNSIYQWWS